MTPPASRRTRLQRVCATLLALLVQLSAVLLFQASRRSRLPEQQHDSPLFIQAIRLPAPLPQQIPDEPDRRRKAIDPEARSTPSPAIPTVVTLPPAESTAITVTQPDFRSSLTDAAKHAAEHGARRDAQGEPLQSKPDVMKLPARPTTGHQRGVPTVRGKETVTIEFDDGVICTFTRQPEFLSQTFEPWSQQRPASCTHKGDGAESAPLLNVEALKPDYLRRALPLPKEPGRTQAAP